MLQSLETTATGSDYTGYGNGHVVLDMGSGEEILDGSGVDFAVYEPERIRRVCRKQLISTSARGELGVGPVAFAW